MRAGREKWPRVYKKRERKENEPFCSDLSGSHMWLKTIFIKIPSHPSAAIKAAMCVLKIIIFYIVPRGAFSLFLKKIEKQKWKALRKSHCEYKVN